MPNVTKPERAFRFHYKTTIPDELTREGCVRVWVPVAQDGDHQSIGALEIACPLSSHSLEIEPTHGNKALYAEVPAGSPTCTIAVSYDVRRIRRKVELPSRAIRAEYEPPILEQGFLPYLSPNAHVPTDGFIAKEARAAIDDEDPPFIRARKLYDYLMEKFVYDTAGCTPERAAELGDLSRACDLRKGTCTEFHGLFVGYARAVGMPAKFAFGFNVHPDKIEGKVAGYHCWAEVYLPVVGWFPVDVTEAVKEAARGGSKDRADFFFGGLNCHRVQLTTGRDIALKPRPPGAPIDKFIFSYAMRGEREVTPQLSFSFSAAREPG